MKGHRMRAVAALGLGLAVAAGATGLAYAADQARPDGQTQRDRDYDRGYDRGDRAGNFLDRRLDYLHRTIGITQAQERLWADFANAVRDTEQDRRPPPRLDRGPGPRDRDFDRDRGRNEASVVDRLQRRQQRLNDESADLNRLLGALRPLYASLSPDQKRAADQNLFHPERQRFAQFRRGGPRLNNFGDGRYGLGPNTDSDRDYGPQDRGPQDRDDGPQNLNNIPQDRDNDYR